MKSQIDGGIFIIICIQPCVVGLTEHKSNLMYEFVHCTCHFCGRKCCFLFLSSSTNSVITFSIINQMTKLRTFLKSTLNGLLKNVQPLLIGPSGTREIEDKKVFPIFMDTLYL